MTLSANKPKTSPRNLIAEIGRPQSGPPPARKAKENRSPLIVAIDALQPGQYLVLKLHSLQDVTKVIGKARTATFAKKQAGGASDPREYQVYEGENKTVVIVRLTDDQVKEIRANRSQQPAAVGAASRSPAAG